MPKVENCGEKKGRIVEEGGKNKKKKKGRGGFEAKIENLRKNTL